MMHLIGECTVCDYDTGKHKSLDSLRSTVAADGGRVGCDSDDLHCPDCRAKIIVEEN